MLCWEKSIQPVIIMDSLELPGMFGLWEEAELPVDLLLEN